MRPSREARTTRQFEQRSAWWDRIYGQTSLEARILRRRQQVALGWVEPLSLSHPAGLRVLEIGCGAGATAVELARRGHLVAALDRSPAMLQRTRNHAVISGVGELVRPILGDAHRLLFPAGTFDLVLALGVLSWLEDPNAAISEMARVTRPDGHVLVTSLNSLDLACLLDPGRTPLLAPARSAARLAAPGARSTSERADPADPTPELVGPAATAPQRAAPHPPGHRRVRTLHLPRQPAAVRRSCHPSRPGPPAPSRPQQQTPPPQRTAAPHPGPQARPRQNLIFVWFHRLVLLREQIAEPTGPITAPLPVPSDLRRRRIAQR
jgi:SAM-dependent methyltransferase